MRRPGPLPLTLGLVALGCLMLAPAVAPAVGGHTAYRRVVVWGVPIAAGLLAAILMPRGAVPAGGAPRGAAARGALRLAPWCAAAFVADYAFLAVGHAAGWVTFTFGDQYLHATVRSNVAWALPLSLALGIFGWERALRGGLLAGWSAVAPRVSAVGVSCAAGVLLALPAMMGNPGFIDAPFLAAALIAAVCRELASSALFLATGSYLAGGAWRGAQLYVDAFVLNDWFSLHFPAANYVSSEPLLYAARIVCAIAALALVSIGARRTAAR